MGMSTPREAPEPAPAARRLFFSFSSADLSEGRANVVRTGNENGRTTNAPTTVL